MIDDNCKKHVCPRCIVNNTAIACFLIVNKHNALNTNMTGMYNEYVLHQRRCH